MRLVRDEVERITFPDGEWVEVKARLSIGERTSLTARAFAVRAGLELRDAEVDLGQVYAAAELAALHVGIVRWSLSEPVNEENIAALDEESATTIKRRLEVLWSPRSDEEKKASGSSTQTPSVSPAPLSPPTSDGS